MLRVVVGASTMTEATLALTNANSPQNLIFALFSALTAIALALGFLTPIASGVIAAVGATLLICVPAAVFHLLDSRMALFELVVMAAALAILGPGAASFDARLFGRREVTIRENGDPDQPSN